MGHRSEDPVSRDAHETDSTGSRAPLQPKKLRPPPPRPPLKGTPVEIPGGDRGPLQGSRRAPWPYPPQVWLTFAETNCTKSLTLIGPFALLCVSHNGIMNQSLVPTF